MQSLDEVLSPTGEPIGNPRGGVLTRQLGKDDEQKQWSKLIASASTAPTERSASRWSASACRPRSANILADNPWPMIWVTRSSPAAVSWLIAISWPASRRLAEISARSSPKLQSAFASAAEVADEWFFETVVRLHRAGEGAAFTGLKPAGLGHGPVVPVAERAIETGDVAELARLLSSALRDEIARKFGEVMRLQSGPRTSVAEEREYVEAMLGFIVWSHKTYRCIQSDPLHAHGSMHHD